MDGACAVRSLGVCRAWSRVGPPVQLTLYERLRPCSSMALLLLRDLAGAVLALKVVSAGKFRRYKMLHNPLPNLGGREGGENLMYLQAFLWQLLFYIGDGNVRKPPCENPPGSTSSSASPSSHLCSGRRVDPWSSALSWAALPQASSA